MGSSITPENPKIYHIVHLDRLASIIQSGFLWSDAEVRQRHINGTLIGMESIKARRRFLKLRCHPHLYVGNCVPFYFCPRSVMLYILFKRNNPEVQYAGGQESIIHLEADLHTVIEWAADNNSRWAFTSSNAGSEYFDDWADISKLNQIDWNAVGAEDWKHCKEKKQAEFLLENRFPLSLLERIGVFSEAAREQVLNFLPQGTNCPILEIRRDWYY